MNNKNSVPKISIILPVYNAEKYIGKTLDSIAKQTFNEFELIIIDDASTDSSIDIINQYKNNFDKFKLFELQTNNGVSKARNIGIQNAIGEYISFIDSDDFIKATFLETMYNNAKKHNADIVCCNYYYVKNNYSSIKKNLLQMKPGLYNSEKLLFSLIRDTNIHFFIWNKLWKRSLIQDNNILFKNNCFEDIAFSSRLFYLAKKIYISKNTLYYYCKHSNSLTAFMSFKDLNNYVLALKDLKIFLEDNNIYNIYKFSYSFLAIRFLLSCSYRIPCMYIKSKPNIHIIDCFSKTFKDTVFLLSNKNFNKSIKK